MCRQHSSARREAIALSESASFPRCTGAASALESPKSYSMRAILAASSSRYSHRSSTRDADIRCRRLPRDIIHEAPLSQDVIAGPIISIRPLVSTRLPAISDDAFIREVDKHIRLAASPLRHHALPPPLLISVHAKMPARAAS
jgi:hypothetical protein